MNQIINIISKNIRKRRQFLNLSQEELAEKSGLHRTYIGSVERGERNITVTSISKISAALEIEPFQLLKDDSNELAPVHSKAKYAHKK